MPPLSMVIIGADMIIRVWMSSKKSVQMDNNQSEQVLGRSDKWMVKVTSIMSITTILIVVADLAL